MPHNVTRFVILPMDSFFDLLLQEEADVDADALMDILQRHDLLAKWDQFKATEQ